MPKQFSRREAAKLIGATAAGVFLPVGAAQVFAAAGESARLILRAIPSTGEKLPVMGLGSALTFDVRGSAAARTVGEVIALFVKQGGKLIDTSPAYGNAESLIGDLAYKAGLTKSLFIATKVWSRDKLQGLAQMEKSLERFRTRTIDLIQVHNLADVDRQMTSLNSLKAKGKIRYTGLTHSERKGHGEMERAMRVHKPDFIQINYSLMDRAAAQRILPLAREMGIARAHQPALWRRRHLPDPGGEESPGLDGRVRLPLLGAVSLEMDRVAPGGDLRHSGNERAKAPRR